jgi:hypothetical protein
VVLLERRQYVQLQGGQAAYAGGGNFFHVF